MSSDAGFSIERATSSFYNYVQRTKGNCIKELRESMMIIIQCIENPIKR